MSTNRKFIESHWLTFAVKGAISVVAGLCLMVTKSQDINFLTMIVGWTMAGLAAIEIFNVVHRARRQHNWGFPLFLGFIELIIAFCELATVYMSKTPSELITLRVSLLSAYVLFASIVTIMMGFGSFKNMTDRFMWIVNGMLGCIVAFAMFNGTIETDHIALFGLYLMINGLTDLFFGVHSKDEAVEAHEQLVAKRAASKKVAKKGSKK